MFCMSPIMSGLALYDCRLKHRDASMTVADSWGSIQYTEHLCNAHLASPQVSRRWLNMDMVKTPLRSDSFYVGCEEPKTFDDKITKFCLQMGTTASAMSKSHQK